MKVMFVAENGVSNIGGGPMDVCNHEEADTRILVHMTDALKNGAVNIMVRTVDTDVIVIIIGQFHDILDAYPDTQIWVVFGSGKHIRNFHINTMSQHLGRDKSRALPPFHALTGCDTTSAFFGKGKTTAWKTWTIYPDITEALLSMVNNIYSPLTLESPCFKAIERFVVLLYDKTSELTSVNEARRDLFSKKNKDLEHLPPSQV